MSGIVSGLLKSVAVAAAVAGAGPQGMTVDTVRMSVQPPAGFCIPEGKAAAAIRLAAAADPGNETNLALVRCEDKDATNPDYYLIKSPRNTFGHTFERAAFLAEVKKALALPEFNKAEGIVDNDKIEKDFANAAGGVKPEINGAVKPIGVDKDCAYLGGVLSFSAGTISYTRSVSLCLTVIGGKVIGVTRYGDGAVPGNVQRQLATARALAMAIKPTS